ncbi:MAG: hypothetical protein Q9192_008349 [Flavoplaca navasiana]
MDSTLEWALLNRPSKSSNFSIRFHNNRRRELAFYRIGRLRDLHRLIDQAAKRTTKLLPPNLESTNAHVKNLQQELQSLSAKMVVYGKWTNWRGRTMENSEALGEAFGVAWRGHIEYCNQEMPKEKGKEKEKKEKKKEPKGRLRDSRGRFCKR